MIPSRKQKLAYKSENLFKPAAFVKNKKFAPALLLALPGQSLNRGCQ